MKLKTAITGTAIISLLSVMIPEVAYAVRCPNSTTSPRSNIQFKNFSGRFDFSFQFNIQPIVTTTSGIFDLGGCYKEPGQSIRQYTLVDLTVTKFSSINSLPDDIRTIGFNDLRFDPDGDSPFYRYDFFYEPLSAFIGFYVPSKFTYQASPQIDLSNSPNLFLRSLKGLGMILSTLKSDGYDPIVFPYDAQIIQGVSESNSFTGLVVLGLIGGLIVLKTKK